MDELTNLSPTFNNCYNSSAIGSGDHNCGEEIELCDQLLEETEVPDNNDVQTTIGVGNFSKLTVDDMERRLEPGQIVENEDIAYALYNRYARAKGFSVRKGRNIKSKSGKGVIGKVFVCSREGLKDEKRSKDKIPDYQKTNSRCQCLAKLQISLRNLGYWEVTQFKKLHNHDMVASDQSYLLRSDRKITDEQELLLTTLLNSKVPISRAITFLENASNGREHVGFIPRDAYDCVSRKNRKTKIENRDTIELMQHFKDKANSEPDFYWDVEVDDDNRLMNFFVRDCRCLIDYGCFSDVLSVDTTYKTNKYDLKCAPFTGINHHKENILFGLAYLSDESEETFKWLFKTFLKSMGGKEPGSVFTDQCKAMMNAVRDIFPNSYHRLCQWHIDQNAPSHFGSLNSDKYFTSLWRKCMNYCETEEVFEETWKEMMDKYELDQTSWFNTMYDLRHKWSTAFSNTTFSAGLMTTSRSEGTNSTLKRHIRNRTSSLLDCVIAYEKVQKDWRLKEKEKDTLCHHNRPTPFVANPLLEHAADVYTHNIFNLFQSQLKDTMGLELLEKVTFDGSPLVSYKLKRYGANSFRTVEYDGETLEIKCSCHHFETVGILCRHALKVFDIVSLRSIPDKYIKKRWTKMAKSEICGAQSANNSGYTGSPGESGYIYEMAFVSNATSEFRELALQGKGREETRKIITNHIESAKKEMAAWFEKMDLNDLSSKGKGLHGDDDVVLDPIVVNTRGTTKAQKSHWQRAKGRGKAQSSKRNTRVGEDPKQAPTGLGDNVKGVKRKVQKSQDPRSVRLSEEETNVHQYRSFQSTPVQILHMANASTSTCPGSSGKEFMGALQYPQPSSNPAMPFINLDPTTHDIDKYLGGMSYTDLLRGFDASKE